MFWLAASLATGSTASADPRAFERSFRPSVAVAGQPLPRWTLRGRMAFWRVPGMSIAVIRGGRIAWVKGFGTRRAGSRDMVGPDTLFSVGSVSKVAAAAVTMRLASAGTVDIDSDVNRYLKRWRVPPGPHTALSPVTLRGLMSHTAGLTIAGFADYKPGEPLPTLIETLDGRPPTKEGAVEVSYTPGTQASYSGGGVEVERLVIEDVLGESFAKVAQRLLLDPLGMTRSTFSQPLPTGTLDVALAHDADGRPRALPVGWETMPQAAASGLWTTPRDYARLMIALRDAYLGRPGALIEAALARAMMTEVGGSHAGLGPFLEGAGATRRFYHSGANDSYRAWMELNLATGNGVVIFTNSPNGAKFRPEVLRAIALSEGWATSDAVCVPAVEISDDRLTAFVGRYETEQTGSLLASRLETEARSIGFDVRRDGGQLTIASGLDATPMPLVAADQSHFYFDRTSEKTVEFVQGYDGTVQGLIYRDREYGLQARRKGR